MTTNNEYKYIALYMRDTLDTPYIRTVCNTKEAALDIIRELKAKHGEPNLGFTENPRGDVLTFRFPSAKINGRLVLMRQELEEHVHCPQCGIAFKRNNDNHSSCHGWTCDWVFDDDNQVWRVHIITKGGS